MFFLEKNTRNKVIIYEQMIEHFDVLQMHEQHTVGKQKYIFGVVCVTICHNFSQSEKVGYFQYDNWLLGK